MFARDRDLLTLEPNLLRDVGWAGQRLVRGTGGAAGTTLAMSSQDAGFDAAGIGAGNIVLVDGTAYEVIERTTPASLVISRLRAAESDPLLPASPVSGVPVEVMTFRPQIALVNAQTMRMLGIDPESGDGPGEASVTNPWAMRLLVSLGALHLVYAAASALAPAGSPLRDRAEMYRERFAAERQRVAARIDTDGDGEADAVRRPSVLLLERQ
ncbi:MAG: hypothetical protein DYG93_06475 [Leptolyngbya sp. PLA2]|nr:hypothetical protein [Leptolyngbya sp.]MCE7971294.1 hypothetical protein [Leptolyngbya sp. PL-A2]MCQ3939653.1 hypothetical protein [cyanobacterium CYA1]MCZ7632101.1 hypothetical protein [Phycisphaerales bacterium]MDL1903910.1 hypothetical protein [Synechococcales cyanobacterium CNB]GIK18673.1 MAG: hypothetical protein BroJett004_08370 [Planctomycetota bacterium]